MRKVADRALQINAKSLDALIVKARIIPRRQFNKASEILERVPDLDKGGEPAELLLDLYLKRPNGMSLGAGAADFRP